MSPVMGKTQGKVESRQESQRSPKGKGESILAVSSTKQAKKS